MTVYKMLTPNLRREITEGIDQMQFEELSALKTLIGKLPDGYPMPFKEGRS